MPTYEYACTACAHEWEFEQSIRDEPLKSCPRCKKKTARRQISRGTGFILKGGGWYSDLYSSGSNKKADDGKAKSDDTKKSTDAKPAATETKSDGGGSPDKPPAKKKDSSAAAA
jgi:putative FmdB family regulatory protein